MSAMISRKLPVSIYALGGLGEVGKNMYCIEDAKSIIIIDSGIRFPEEGLPGVDYVIPDYTHLKNNSTKVKALFITHGHEDHIGGIPFLIQNIFVPIIYAPKLAAALIRHKLDEMHIRERVNIVEYTENDFIKVGDSFVVQFFQVTHSIPDSFGICVDTSEGRIVTTGDFKIDLTPVGPDINLGKMAKLGTEGVDILMSDSTNAEIEGYTPSETNVINSINEVFRNAPGRLIVSTFSSNISRIQQIVEASVAHNRKIVIIGRSMENAVETARNFGYIHIPDASLVRAENLKSIKAEETTILCTGSQGEPMAALARIANGEHKTLRIIPGDTVVFSSSPIPGNGASIDRVVNTLTKAGANVLTNSVFLSLHSSGHPSKQELRLALKLFKPKYFMPVHGEYRMLKIHTDIAVSLGIPRENTFILGNGDVLELKNHKVTEGPHIQADDVFIDGNDVSGVCRAVINDREILYNDGMVAVLLVLDSKNNRLMQAPKIYTRGFVYTYGHDNLIGQAENYVQLVLDDLMKEKVKFSDLKNVIKSQLSIFFFKKTQRRPMIIPVIMNKNN
ncbi:MAG: ribonuclease J [Erysipelotrichaceae bacterium]|mgnify:CR=1 FL=1|nr:ribonuclease J [Erysipelotrichaceae bacterium]